MPILALVRRTWPALLALLAAAGLVLPGAAQPSPRARAQSLPGDAVRWLSFPQQKKPDPKWNGFLADLEGHLPAEYKDQFRADDPLVHAHETTHGINAHIRNQHVATLGHVNSFYVGEGRAVVVREPGLRLSEVAALVPEALRRQRYKTYLVAQQKHWEAEPLYLFDEWVAYGNGARVALEAARPDGGMRERSDAVFAVLELGVYAAYTALAARKLDPAYDSRQLTEFLAWNLRRSMALYRQGYRLESYNWDGHAYLRQLRTSPEAAGLRQFLQQHYGLAWYEDVLGL